MGPSDVSMVDVAASRNHFSRQHSDAETDDLALDKMNIDPQSDPHDSHPHDPDASHHNDLHHNDSHSQPPPPTNQSSDPNPALDPAATVPMDIKWVQGGTKVYVTGSFTGWRKMIGLVKLPDGSFSITLGLPVGTHRFRFVVDNELRFSDFMPTATDQMGNFVNYFEVTPEHIRAHHHPEPIEEREPQSRPISRKPSINRPAGRSDSMWGLTNDDDDMGGGYSRYHDGEDENLQGGEFRYIADIPPIFTDPKVMEQYYIAIDKQSKSPNGQQQAWLHPPHLPPHLENVILNNFNPQDKENNLGALSIPNHVVLNHLATTSIKHNTLAAASIVRYKRKYVTQVLYAPLQQ